MSNYLNHKPDRSFIPKQETPVSSICPICCSISNKILTNLPDCKCQACTSCIDLYLKFQIDNKNILQIECPVCQLQSLPSTFIKSSLSLTYQNKYEKFRLRQSLENNPYVRFCVKEDCEGYCIGDGKTKKLSSAKCKQIICFFCSGEWHEGTKCVKRNEEEFESWVNKNNVKFCPNCKRRVEKQGGCPSMECLCKHIFCWNCGKNPQTPLHGLVCLIGTDYWNLNSFAILSMIFVPILICFLPAFITILGSGIMGEPNREYWVVRNKKVFYTCLILFSPLIEAVGVFVFIFGIGYLFSEKGKNRNLIIRMFLLFAGVTMGLGISIVSVILLLLCSLICTVLGFAFLTFKLFHLHHRRILLPDSIYPRTLPRI